MLTIYTFTPFYKTGSAVHETVEKSNTRVTKYKDPSRWLTTIIPYTPPVPWLIFGVAVVPQS